MTLPDAVYQWGQRTTPMTLAAEIRHQLLPSASCCEAPQFTVACALVPAGGIGGDTDEPVPRPQVEFLDEIGDGRSDTEGQVDGETDLLDGAVEQAHRSGMTGVDQLDALFLEPDAQQLPGGHGPAAVLQQRFVGFAGLLGHIASAVDLPGLLCRTRHLHPRQTVHELTDAVKEACNGRPQDDATVMCLDWHGRRGVPDVAGQ